MKHQLQNPRRHAGFSLIEVLVALVVTSIGLLGLAKMSSLALSSTGVASSRSLAAIEASSLAASMHSNRGYWGAGRAPAVTPVNAGNNFSTAIACTTPGATACNVDQMAFYDLQQWALALQSVLPGYNATITCSTSGFPVNCTIQIQWVENAVASNSAQNNLVALQAPTYTVYVEP